MTWFPPIIVAVGPPTRRRDVVFKRVGARHVIIVAVLPTPDYTAGLVFPATLRLVLDLDEAVGDRSTFLHAPRKGAGARLTKHVRPAGRRAIRLHGPARTALTGHAALPTRGYGVAGQGSPRWTVESDRSAPSGPNVLRQAGSGTFPWCVKKGASISDGFVEVKFKPERGREDQAGGVVWRWKDGNNYYVARANALEDNVSPPSRRPDSNDDWRKPGHDCSRAEHP